MLIVTGDLIAKTGAFAALFAAGRAHSERSRGELGCIGHECFADPDNSNRLFFFERWADRAALDAHFKTPGIAQLMLAVREHATGRGQLDIYAAEPQPGPG